MAKQVINIGLAANDGSGDPLRTAFDKCNDNFTEVYDDIAALSGSSDLIVDILYADLLTAISESTLSPGTFYQITDKGDRGVILQALSESVMSTVGIRRMLCPFTYAVTGDWLGIWNSSLTPSVDELAIWGGLVWKNLTGAVGTASDDVTLDGTNWEVVPKATFANNEYKEMIFGIMFDFDLGTYTKQWDGRGNVITAYGSGFSFNTCDVTDWNWDIVSDSFFDNVCKGVFNNSNASEISCNRIAGAIYNNSCRDIYLNTNNGDISNNTNNGIISLNTNDGNISNNTNNGPIQTNNNLGDISDNSNDGEITDNSNSSSIDTNSNLGDIINNSNNGAISSVSSSPNSCNVNNNINNGYIIGFKTSDVTDPIVNK